MNYFGHKVTIAQGLEIRPNVELSGTLTDYCVGLKKISSI